MAIKGYATPEGTQRYRNRYEGQDAAGVFIADGHFRETEQGLALTSLGMGTYLGDLDGETCNLMTSAAKVSVATGAINVLDTAINYRYQLSERALAKALEALLSEGIRRNEVFVCSKNGFITPDAAELAKGNRDFQGYFKQYFIESGRIQPEDVAGGMHCMAPGFLSDQLDRSLNNLNLETLDLMYLHNAAESQIPAVGRVEFMKRLQRAFEFYEQARRDNKLRYYGMATWSCFRLEPDADSEYLSLEAVVRLAEQVGGPEHGFRFIQLPFNLAFSEALTLANQPVDGSMMSLFEAAMTFGIGVFTSVPLLQGQLLNQNNLPHFEGMHTPAQQCLQFIRSNPGVLAPLVGHKDPQHVRENLQVASVPPMMLAEFEELLST